MKEWKRGHSVEENTGRSKSLEYEWLRGRFIDLPGIRMYIRSYLLTVVLENVYTHISLVTIGKYDSFTISKCSSYDFHVYNCAFIISFFYFFYFHYYINIHMYINVCVYVYISSFLRPT